MTWIQTYIGAAFDLEHPSPSLVDIVDISRALSHLCRYTGHCRRFYSVAEHSVHVSRLLWTTDGVTREEARHLARWGLLHDAAEAYVGDVASPLKRLLPAYREIEGKVAQAVQDAFGLTGEMPADVKAADMVMLVSEAKQLLGPAPKPWAPCDRAEPLPLWCPHCWEPARAMDEFMCEFWRLFPEHADRKVVVR